MASEPSLTTIVESLAAASVELVLVGGLAAAAQGAPIATFDVDIVHHRTDENVTRLLGALLAMDAHYRGRPGGEILRPTAEILLGPGHSLLRTTFGPLDVLGAIEGGRDYAVLLPRSVAIPFRGHQVRVLELALIVELKRQSTHPKDLARLPILEETLRRQRGLQ